MNFTLSLIFILSMAHANAAPASGYDGAWSGECTDQQSGVTIHDDIAFDTADAPKVTVNFDGSALRLEIGKMVHFDTSFGGVDALLTQEQSGDFTLRTYNSNFTGNEQPRSAEREFNFTLKSATELVSHMVQWTYYDGKVDTGPIIDCSYHR